MAQKRRLEDIEQDVDWSETFRRNCKNKMIIGRLKYGPWKDNQRDVDALGSLLVRLREYEATGNMEMLEDISNFAMMEWMIPRNPKAHRDGVVQKGPQLKKFDEY
jgi:hypothetical protein